MHVVFHHRQFLNLTMLPFADRPYSFFHILSDISLKNPQSVLGAPHHVIAALVDHVRQLFPFRHSCIVLRHQSDGKAHQDMTTAEGGGLSSLTQESESAQSRLLSVRQRTEAVL